VRARGSFTFNSQIERAHCKPWGLEGGGDATGNKVDLRLGGSWKTDFPNAKVLVAALKAGDAFRLRSGGGGGHGPAFERPVEDVQEDVRQGYVSAAAAAEQYGVVIEPDTFAVDHAATERRRATLRRQAMA
jgi:N-methylhydantoinase B